VVHARGGWYVDSDASCVRPFDQWTAPGDRAGLVVGVEADRWPGHYQPVQARQLPAPQRPPPAPCLPRERCAAVPPQPGARAEAGPGAADVPVGVRRARGPRRAGAHAGPHRGALRPGPARRAAPALPAGRHADDGALGVHHGAGGAPRAVLSMNLHRSVLYK